MSDPQETLEMAQLIALPAFRRLLWRVVDAAGLLHPAYGSEGRDLAYREGRRSLALDLIRMADAGQPLGHPAAVGTWLAILADEHRSLMEKRNDRDHDRSGRAEPGADDHDD